LTALSDAELVALIRPVNAGLKLITFRLEVILLSLLTCGLFSWSVYDPQPYRIVAASIFALFCLAVMRTTKVSHAQESLPSE
jgi:Ca2+/Na+ antiporter